MGKAYDAFDELFVDLMVRNWSAFNQALGPDREQFQSLLRSYVVEDWQENEPERSLHLLVVFLIQHLMYTQARSLTRATIYYAWQELQKESPDEAPIVPPYGVGELFAKEKGLRRLLNMPVKGLIKRSAFPLENLSLLRSYYILGDIPGYLSKGIVGESSVEYGIPQPPLSPDPPPSHSNRYLTGKMPGEVKLGDPFSLTVQITVDALPTEPSSGSAPFPEMAGDILLTVHGTGVEFPDGAALPLKVPAAGNSEEATFKVKAIAPGVQRIEISAWNQAARIAGLSLRVAVDTVLPPMPGKSAPVDIRSPEAGEYTLEIISAGDNGQYRFQLRGRVLGVMEPVLNKPLKQGESEQYKSLLDNLNALAKNKDQLTKEQQMLRPRAVGNFLFKYMVPEVIQEALWEIRDDIRRLNIICDGAAIPWELLYVSKKGAGQGFFLGAIAGVARWRYGPPAPSRINGKPPYFVQAGKSLAYAAGEIQQLKKLFAQAETIQNVDGLLALLKAGQFGMLHFASHNMLQADDAMATYIPFANGRFELVDLGSFDDDKFLAAAPLVFMNSCASAATAPLLTGLSSWADQYLKLGAGAFIGSLWDVVDDSAPLFAVTFYTKAIAGATLGEALKAARETIASKDPGDPTWLAYTLYGNPLAKFEIP